jgi:hypothetical protein
MARKRKARAPKKQSKKKGSARTERSNAAAPKLDESGAKFERAFAKIAPPKGFSIKRPQSGS